MLHKMLDANYFIPQHPRWRYDVLITSLLLSQKKQLQVREMYTLLLDSIGIIQ